MDPIEKKPPLDPSQKSEKPKIPPKAKAAAVAAKAFAASQDQASSSQQMAGLTVNTLKLSQEQINTQVREMNLTRRLSEEQKVVVVSKLTSLLPTKDQGISVLLSAINTSNWQAVNDDLDFPNYALLAYMEGLITIEQFGTIQLYWGTLQDYEKKDIEIIPIFHEDGTVNEQVKKLVIDTLRVQPTKQLPAHAPLLTEEQVNDFFNRIQHLPKSAQQLFIVPSSEEYGIRQHLKRKAQFNFLSFSEILGKKHAIASLELFGAFLDCCYGKNAVKMTPLLGPCLPEDFWIPNERVVAIAYPNVPLPKMADEFLAEKSDDFTYHDLFHVFTCSNIPESHRHLWINIAQIVLSQLKKASQKQEQAPLQKLYETLLDMDFPLYRPDLNQGVALYTLEEKFWDSFMTTILITVISTPKDITDPTKAPESIDWFYDLFAEIGKKLPLDPSLTCSPAVENKLCKDASFIPPGAETLFDSVYKLYLLRAIESGEAIKTLFSHLRKRPGQSS